MCKAKYVILFVVVFAGVVRTQRLSVGDLCTFEKTQNQGVCKLLLDCSKAREGIQQGLFPQTCGFQGTQPIVCCEQEQQTLPPVVTTPVPEIPTKNDREPGVISKRKCREYSRYVYERTRPPILLINVTETEKNQCGHKVVTLIIGGEPASRKEFPHMALVGYELTPGDIKWLCGGTIISKQYILTAAHCLISKDFGPAKYIRMGITNKFDDSIHKQEYPIAERIRYPQYKASSHYHDIALIKLETPAKMTPFARPACLYLQQKIQAQKAIATGWGDTQYGGSSSDDLQKVTLDLFNHTFCNSSYKNQVGTRRLRNGIDDDMQVCAGSVDEEKDTCQGDSGGPLQIYHFGDNVKCMYDIIGVTSFGKACTGSPGVYIRVSRYVKWIEDIVWP